MGEAGPARAWASFAATTAAGAGALGALAVIDPNEPGHYPTCPFLAVTGAYCPGCGSLRALHALLHVDPSTALARNPLALALGGFVLVAWVCWGLRVFGHAAWHPTRIGPRWIWGLLALVLTYWLLRNVPGWTWLSPA